MYKLVLTKRGFIPLLLAAGVLAIPLTWSILLIRSNKTPVSLELQTSQDGEVQLRWGEIPQQVITLVPEDKPTPHRLEVVATGEKNERSHGSEVWILGLWDEGKMWIPPSALSLGEGWEMRDGVPLSFRDQPSTLTWQGVTNGLRLQFLRHDRSGKALIRWDEEEITLDLYAPTPQSQFMEFNDINRQRTRYWKGELPPQLIENLWLHFGEGITEGAIVRLTVGSNPPQEWAAQTLAEGTAQGLEVEQAGQGLRFHVVSAPGEIRLPGFVPIVPGRFKVSQTFWTWLGLTALLAAMLLAASRIYAKFSATPDIGQESALPVPAAGDMILPHLPQRSLLRQMLLPWLLVTPLVAAASAIITSQLLLYAGWQKGVWLSVEVNASDWSHPPPSIQVSYNGNPSDSLPILWENRGDYTFVGIRPLSGTQSLKILWIDTDQGPVPPGQLKLPSWWELREDVRALLVTGPGLLGLPGTYHTITLTFEAGPGTGAVEIVWLDQQTVVDLSAQPPGPYQVQFDLPPIYRGWALLPPQPIEQISLHLGNDDTSYSLRELFLLDEVQQVWPASALVTGQLRGEGCHLAVQGDGLLVEKRQSASCTLALPNMQAMNVVLVPGRLFIWASITILGLSGLGLLSYLAGIFRRWEAGYEIVESRPGAWLRQRTRGWTAGKIALVVGIIAVAFHLAYAFFVPMGYTPDSLGYYTMSRDFLKTLDFDAFGLYRTPGYPLFIAFTIWLFGDQVQGIVLLQHLALAMLGPLAVWFLYPRTNPLFAALGGLLAGLSPVISVTGNIVWTESLFTVAGCLALFIFAHHQQRRSGIFLAGLLVGLATMVRPNGIMLLGVMLAWLFVQWWCSPARIQLLRRAAECGAALLLGYLVIAMPWYLHFHSRTGRWVLTTAPDFALWISTIIQDSSPPSLPINRPYRAIWDFPWSTTYRGGRDPWALMSNQAFVGMPLSGDNRIFQLESWRESLRHDPRLYLRTVREAFLYNLLHTSTEQLSSVHYYRDLSYFPDFWSSRAYPIECPAAGKAADIEALLGQMSCRWEPPESPLRLALLWTSRTGINGWGITSVLALCSLVVCLLFAPLRSMTLFWLYFLINVSVTAALSYAIDRYVMVAEPLLYLLVILLVFVFFGLRLRKRDETG
jgi:hypothetical protein